LAERSNRSIKSGVTGAAKSTLLVFLPSIWPPSAKFTLTVPFYMLLKALSIPKRVRFGIEETIWW
jgi:hypothetical protein